MPPETFYTALAGLLHDMDSFAQRANHTAGPVISEIVPSQWLGEIELTNGNNALRDIVATAARLVGASAGPTVNQGGSPLLASIFGSLDNLKDDDGQTISPPEGGYRPLTSLRIAPKDAAGASPIFPVEAVENPPAAYKKLWADFLEQVSALKDIYGREDSDQTSYLNSLLYIMQRYCWSIPAAGYPGRADVSLYDHSRVTAALAVCLAERNQETEHRDDDPAVALLVGGDISGIQDFIYTITAKGATSSLRGRSMYLQLLTQVVARYVLDKLNLPLTNLLYAGGGHFYMIVPVRCQSALTSLHRQISSILLQHHQGDLYLGVAHRPLYRDSLYGRRFSEQWHGLTEALQQAKNRRFSELEPAQQLALFAPQEHGGDANIVCAVTQREHPGTQAWADDEERGGEKVLKSPPTYYLEELGRDLRRASYMGLYQLETPAALDEKAPPGTWNEILGHFGYQVEFYRTLNQAAKSDIPPNRKVIRHSLLALNDDAWDDPKLTPAPGRTVGRHLLVNITPLLTPEEYRQFKDKIPDLRQPYGPDYPVKPFDVLAYQARGIKRWGVLRMDVDNLGAIFRAGLGEQANLARIASLSFAFTLFFEGWIEQIAAEITHQAEPELIYSIYSGGDDLFFVGSWHLMPDLAAAIGRDLQRYSGRHPGIHMSGGIALAGSKYPLYQAAADAAKAEKAAKANRWPKRKQALNFLGQTVPWGAAHFDTVVQEKDRLVKLVQPPNGGPAVPMRLLWRLNRFYYNYNDIKRKLAKRGLGPLTNGQPRLYWGPWHWRGVYLLTRLAQQNSFAGPDIIDIRDTLSKHNFSNLPLIGLAARWAELLVRDR